MPSFAAVPRDEQLRRLQSLALSVLEAYGLEDSELDILQYEDNAVYRVTDGAGRRFVLRISSPEGGASVAAQTSELSWLRALNVETELTVPRPIVNLDGALVTPAAAGDVGSERCCVLFDWVRGELPEPGLNHEKMAELGAFTAALHQHSQSFVTPAGFVRPRWDCSRVFGAGSSLENSEAMSRISVDQRALLTELRAEVRRGLEGVGAGPHAWGLVHGDLHRDNILFDAERVAAIDFDDCGFGYFLYDVASVLDSFYRRIARSAENYALLREAYLGGYDRVRSLPRDVDTQLRLFKAMRDMVNINFILLSTNDAVRAWGPARVDATLERVAGFLAGRPCPGA